MKPGGQGNSGDAASQKSGDASVWLEHARWVWQQQRLIYDGLGQRAVAFLSIDGVLLALLANAESKIHGFARGVMFAAIWIALASAVLALCAMLPQPAQSLPVTGLRGKWRDYQKSDEQTDLAASLTEMLLMVKGPAESVEVGPLAELRAHTRSRGRLTKWSGICATSAIGLVAVALTVQR
jgi:hypothetical protein